MQTICPKCRHVRQPSEIAPEWRCPTCGVAYAKAESAKDSPRSASRTSSIEYGSNSSLSWRKAVAIVAVALGAWQGMHIAKHRNASFDSVGANISGQVSAAELAQLASTVKAGEVVIYTTAHCPYCAQAKSWMGEYGFAYTECNADIRSECARDLESFGSDGVPYLIVRGTHMKHGFDSDQFVAALR